jgi:glutamate synthase domain-containing protein 2/glutamate synthase domain-containing protein 1/glutamate synthase domain-containing protein 3
MLKDDRRYSNPPKQGLYDPSYEHDACGVGFIVDMKGRPSHQTVKDALEILINLDHRGACGCDPNSGDGAGILMRMPHKFLSEAAQEAGYSLPDEGQYACGLLYLPQDPAVRAQCEKVLEEIIEDQGQQLIGWRDVPCDGSILGSFSKPCEPVIRQVFIAKGDNVDGELDFERKLYIIRREVTNKVNYLGIDPKGFFYVASLSSRVLGYKGMLTTTQMIDYFADLSHPAMETSMALVHSRFSTNTFPNWPRAQPFRYMSHNGEINTLRGNVNSMLARQSLLESELFGNDIKKILPVIREDGSDSAMFDNCLEFLVLSGRSLPHAVMMMIPEPWEKHESMPDDKRAFYEYHATLMEPWDGPASIAFMDGRQIGAVLDRNGLRPSRYYVTKDDRVIMASEVGVLPVDPAMVLKKGRLEPGRMFLVDTTEGRIIDDKEIKESIANQHPYREWLDAHLLHENDLPEPDDVHGVEHETVRQRQRAFGYTFEDLRFLLGPMAETGVEPIGAMGNDAPLAVLSDRPQLLYNYFKQLFAQVTNPAIDSIREAIITASDTFIGSERNLLNPEPESARMIKLDQPVIDNRQLQRLRKIGQSDFKAATIPILFTPDLEEIPRDSPLHLVQAPEVTGRGLEAGLAALFEHAEAAINDGVNILILSDRGLDKDNVPIPALLAVSGLHHHLIRNGTRTKVSIILESGEPREVHHFSVLLGFGVDAINPYLAFETLYDMIHSGELDMEYEKACANYIKAGVKGIIKTMSKMGISTVASYRGAQIFEAVGLNKHVVDRYFSRTATRIEGVGLKQIAAEVKMRHLSAFPDRPSDEENLDSGGLYQWRADGERHLFSPEAIHKLQVASQRGEYQSYQEYARLINEQAERLCTLRGLMDFKFEKEPIPIEEVEPAEEIVKRFKTGAMSYGSISKETHESLAIAMNRLGGKSNTGEGGEDPERFFPDENGDWRRSAIKQVASGRFGVTSYYLVNSDEIQIKVAQGAKPGEGGQLPGHKVYPEIAKVRGTTPGVGLISPPPHHDIYSIEDLAQLIHDLKNSNVNARINVKLVSEIGVGTIAAGVAKGKADVVLISGYDGGTGASPRSSIIHAGSPWELGLAETNQTLLMNNLRSRIVVEVDGQLKTGRDVVVGALLGAEEFGFSTAPLVTLGCLMMRVCHKNTCPVGIATQDPRLRKKFSGDPNSVVNYFKFMAEEIREYMAKLGFRTFDEMVGRSDKLEKNRAIEHWKAQGLDLSGIFYKPDCGPDVGTYCTIPQDHGIEKSLDVTRLLDICRPAIENGEPVRAELPIINTNRVVGTITGAELSRRHGIEGLPEDTIQLKFNGSAGQSFGAFVPRGMTLEVEGDANDYLGKGLSGGKIIIYPPKTSPFVAEENILIGNVAFYGATAGKAYVSGVGGERFCVRNSGVEAVIEAVGDHGCEYMTGGKVVILGPTGRNFAAGMSGGVAYVLDEKKDFQVRLNTEMVGLYELIECLDEEIAEVKGMVENHVKYTGSQRGKRILDQWDTYLPMFRKVLPRDYERMLNAFKRMEEAGLKGDEAIAAAFKENCEDAARVGGN